MVYILSITLHKNVFVLYFLGVICAFLSGICPVDILGEVASIAALITYIFVHVSLIVVIIMNLCFN